MSINLRSIYRYVDTHYQTKEGRAKQKWVRMDIADIPAKLLSKTGSYNVFATVQRFKVAAHSEGEEQWCGLYFDIDNEESLDISKDDAIKVVDFFHQLGLHNEYIHIYFSGKKGFHIIVDPEPFGIIPNPELTNIIKICCLWIAESQKLKSLDVRAYSIRRVLRLTNSIHQSSRLYKVELSSDELHKLSINEIKTLAQTPRDPLWGEPAETPIEPEFGFFWKQFVDEYQNYKTLQNLRPRESIKIKEGKHPPCIVDLLENSIRKPTTRNQAVLLLTSYFKDVGEPEAQALDQIIAWSKKIPKELSTSKVQERINHARACVRSVYSDVKDSYHFACQFVRSLGDVSEAAEEKYRIKCLRNNCPYMTAKNQEVIEPIEVELEQALSAAYLGQPLKIQGLVAGKDQNPYTIKTKIKIICPCPDSEKCIGCGIKEAGGEFIISIKPESPKILQMFDETSKNIIGSLRAMAKVPPKCAACTFEWLESDNVVDVQLLSVNRFNPESEIKQKEYSLVQGYHIGREIKNNQTYEFVAYHYPEPKTQHSVLILTKSKELQDSTEIEINKEMEHRLKIFQPDKPDDAASIWDKLSDIWNDFEHNITHIYNRQTIGVGMDLVYHSPLSFYFENERNFVKRGWCEALIIGDAGTGKTTMAQAIVNHYQLGAFVGAETLRRTGLTYSIQQTGRDGHWTVIFGIAPLNDGKIVLIDEFKELPMSERASLTAMRSEGEIMVMGVATAYSRARVRFIFFTNPYDPQRPKIKNYDYGVETIHDIFRNYEDQRRLDLMMVMAAEDTKSDLFSQPMCKNIPHKYTSDLCNALVRWAWNLSPQQIKFTPESIDEIFKAVKFFAEKYDPIIPLLLPEELRYKLGRLSAALAARVFSVEKDPKNGLVLVIKKEHVRVIKEFLDKNYSGRLMKFDSLSRRQHSLTVSPEVKKRIKEGLMTLFRWDQALGFDDEKYYEELERFVMIILELKYFSKKTLFERMGWAEEKGKQVGLTNFFEKNRLVEYVTTKGFYKRPVLIEILHEIDQDLEKIKARHEKKSDEPIPF